MTPSAPCVVRERGAARRRDRETLTDRFTLAAGFADPTRMEMLLVRALNLARASTLGGHLRKPKRRASGLVVLATAAETERYVTSTGYGLV